MSTGFSHSMQLYHANLGESVSAIFLSSAALHGNFVKSTSSLLCVIFVMTDEAKLARLAKCFNFKIVGDDY